MISTTHITNTVPLPWEITAELHQHVSTKVWRRQHRRQVCLSWLHSSISICSLFVSGITDFSYPRPFVPKNERSLWRTFAESSPELSFPRLFVPRNFRSLVTKVPWNFRSWDLSFSGTFVPRERKFPGTFVTGTFRSQELSFPYCVRWFITAV